MSGLHLDFATDHNPLILETQPVFQPPHCAATYPVPHQFAYEDVMRDTVKSLANVNLNNIPCSPLTHRSSDLITGYLID